jgi:hypothetical protein
VSKNIVQLQKRKRSLAKFTLDGAAEDGASGTLDVSVTLHMKRLRTYLFFRLIALPGPPVCARSRPIPVRDDYGLAIFSRHGNYILYLELLVNRMRGQRTYGLLVVGCTVEFIESDNVLFTTCTQWLEAGSAGNEP